MLVKIKTANMCISVVLVENKSLPTDPFYSEVMTMLDRTKLT